MAGAAGIHAREPHLGHTRRSGRSHVARGKGNRMNQPTDYIGDLFGEPISIYSRRQAIEDGVLVDIAQAVTPCPFKYPVAMTRAAYDATLAAGGTWEENADGTADLKLPSGQDCAGRAWDVFQVMLAAIRSGRSTDRIRFSVLVDVHGNGRKSTVDLYSVCRPGDDAAPVLTILLVGED